MAPPVGLEHPYPHRVVEIREEEWDRTRQYLIRSSEVYPRFGQQPNPENHHQPTHHLDVKGKERKEKKRRLIEGQECSRSAGETQVESAKEQQSADPACQQAEVVVIDDASSLRPAGTVHAIAPAKVRALVEEATGSIFGPSHPVGRARNLPGLQEVLKSKQHPL
ncbi:uncharacterized protein A4U43_C04F22300 [Asparagus officinalis]|uniref:Uncharacterized protein n=1 Tax=Asparagus officinalis TaxID=4686 RepID=A0A5P1F2X6_ASPOF|nr:uncharacterized protein A4U43_C04F22300 [Asparagus officinalis]